MYKMKTEAPIVAAEDFTDGRRVELTTDERKEFKKTVNSFPTMVAASKALVLSKNTIERVMLVGSAHPDTYKKIVEYWERKNVA